MKKLSIEEKAKAYDEAIKKAKEMYEQGMMSERLEYIFPELQESEGERIRKAAIEFVRQNKSFNCCLGISKEDAIAWLEKQGEQKPTDNLEPKFKVGDWAVSNLDGKARQISEVHFNEYNSYYVVDGKSVNLKEYDRLHHLWTIQDAKDGNVLVSNYGKPFIYNGNHNSSHVGAYCGISTENRFNVATEKCCWTSNVNIRPATKEQHDTLMKAMADAGYTFDFEKKELRKIENEIEISFGAKDSELQEVTYYIPKGFHAEIDDDKVVIKKGEKLIAWSEEDEEFLRRAINVTKDAYPMTAKWLKSLRTQNKWKPSEEQLEALKNAIHLKPFENPSDSLLWGLYEQLKKLK